MNGSDRSTKSQHDLEVRNFEKNQLNHSYTAQQVLMFPKNFIQMEVGI